MNSSSFIVTGKRDQGQKLEGERGSGEISLVCFFGWLVGWLVGWLACRTTQRRETDDIGKKGEVPGNDLESKTRWRLVRPGHPRQCVRDSRGGMIALGHRRRGQMGV